MEQDKFTNWFTEAIKNAELAEYTEVSGCLILRPRAFAIWEKIQQECDKRFKRLGVKNAYFPLFIPEKFLEKEKEHVEGFAPEVAWVTHAGNSKLPERLAVRPTSETIMYPYYAKWIRSWRDLPLRLNQWCNVVRWEFKHPIPFLRTREFLWNEGHTVFATQKEAELEEKQIMGAYKEVCEDYLALPGYMGLKTEKEKFAGAEYTVSIEHLMPNKKAIQGPDFHHDGQNFAKAFDIRFLDQNEKKQYVWQNTWAISTRQIGIMLAVHGDEKGFIIPPRMAPEKAVIVPIFTRDSKEKVLKKAAELVRKLPDAFVDYREEYSPGSKFHEWEKKGVPIRIELGPKDLASKTAVIVRRDTGQKRAVTWTKLAEEVSKTLTAIQRNLFKKADTYLKGNTWRVKNYTEFKQALKKGGFIQACWCGSRKCEDKIKDETGAKITNLPYDYQKLFSQRCVCGDKSKYVAHWAKSY